MHQSEQQPPRCRILVAAAGYGKTTVLHRWVPAAGTSWHRGTAVGLGRLVRDAVAAGESRVVLDDLPRLPEGELPALQQALAQLPGTLSVLLASRWPLTGVTRWPGPDRWTELGAADLALHADQVAEVLAGEYGLTDPDLAARVHDATGGWPVLTHLAAEAVRQGGVPAGPLAAAVTEPGGALASYLAEEVFGSLPERAVDLIRLVGDLEPVTAGLCGALGDRAAGQVLAVLRRLGVLIQAGPVAGHRGDRIVPVVAAAARHAGPAGRSGRLATAAEWYDRNGPPVAAAQAHRLAGDPTRCAAVLTEHGDGMIAAGRAETVTELLAALPERLRSRPLWLLHGDAQRTLGDLDGAVRSYDRAADLDATMDAALAWRTGRIHYQRGNALAALAAFERGLVCGGPAGERALLLAWTANARLLAGDTDAALASARQAVAVAADAGLERELATAYLSVTLCLSVAGDAAGSEEYYALALPIAERTADMVLLARIHTNRTYQLLRLARYTESLASAQMSARYAAAACSPSLRAIATCNEADALAMLGRFDEAVRRYEAALSDYQQAGSRRFAGALLGLGWLYQRRGWDEQARAAYEEAARVAETVGNAHVLVHALAGLALVLLDADPAAAAACAERAADAATAENAGPALLARGWVVLRAADPGGAASLAAEAARIARTKRDRAGLADALELRAATEHDPARVRAALREAHAIWAEAGAAVEAARVLVLLSRLTGAGTDDRLNGLLAAEELATAGVRADQHTLPAAGGDTPAGEVAIRALGRFEVLVGGQAVPTSVWKSRKARDLLRILVARRGRPVPRSELCELLWPEDDPGRTGHRLSVLLSIVRGALDPARAHGVDRFVVADQTSIALDTGQVRVDVEDFLAHVAHGRRLVERDAMPEGRAILLAADREYRADAFEDEPYAEWAGALREEVRAGYLDMLRLLARTSRAVGGPGDAVQYLLRLLERDPYDEPAHRGLVRGLAAGGHHGEARRALARYQDAMRAIGVRPPDGASLLPGRPPRVPAAT